VFRVFRVFRVFDRPTVEVISPTVEVVGPTVKVVGSLSTDTHHRASVLGPRVELMAKNSDGSGVNRSVSGEVASERRDHRSSVSSVLSRRASRFRVAWLRMSVERDSYSCFLVQTRRLYHGCRRGDTHTPPCECSACVRRGWGSGGGG
jgi:hypothetical protein